MRNNSLIVYNNGINGKIKRLFRNIFKKKRNKVLLLPEAIQTQNTQITKEIIIPLDKERERIIKLQHKFQNQEIGEQDISAEDIDKLKKLYNTQIRDLKNKIERDILEVEKYKNEIMEIKLKL